MAKKTVDTDEGNISLALTILDHAKAAEVFDALAQGGKVTTPFGDAEWGGKFGAVHDRFGTEWYVATQG
jgi:PhnB protein